MEAAAHAHRTFARELPANRGVGYHHPSLLATMLSYFIIFYLYSFFGVIVMTRYPEIRVSYVLYLMLGILPFLVAVNRSAVQVLRDHLPFVLLFLLNFAYISLQYVLLDMASIPIVREVYFERGQFLTGALVSLIAFELAFSFRNLLTALYIVVIVSCAINVVEFFNPAILPLQLVAGSDRAAGFYQNPNASAIYIASAIPLLCGTARSARRLLCYTITGIGTFLTFSRGGWALWLAAVIITEIGRTDWRNFRLDARRVAIIAAGVIVLIALFVALGPALSFLIRELGSNLDANTTIRLEVLANDTTAYRLADAWQGLIAFTDAPIFGNGVGYTLQWVFGESVHNMFVLMLAEQGILGFIWLMALLVVWWRYPRPYGWWLVVLFCITAFTTHNYFDGVGPAILITLYLVASHKLGRHNSPKAEIKVLRVQSR